MSSVAADDRRSLKTFFFGRPPVYSTGSLLVIIGVIAITGIAIGLPENIRINSIKRRRRRKRSRWNIARPACS
jgi:hypothetical protein